MTYVISNLTDVQMFYNLYYYLGVLLYGPPGCGKTSLVRSIASSVNLNVITAMAAELYSPYLGVTEANISQLFQRARANIPTILFIDEIGNMLFSQIYKNNLTFIFIFITNILCSLKSVVRYIILINVLMNFNLLQVKHILSLLMF